MKKKRNKTKKQKTVLVQGASNIQWSTLFSCLIFVAFIASTLYYNLLSVNCLSPVSHQQERQPDPGIQGSPGLGGSTPYACGFPFIKMVLFSFQSVAAWLYY